MKIVLTGGGTGGHFYPIVAIAQEINEEIRAKRLLGAKLYYLAPEPYNESLLFDNQVKFIPIPAGKTRRYFALKNFSDSFKTMYGSLLALWKVYVIFPDVVFGKGGYASFPALLAARILRIPVVIHESDSRPGRVNAWAAKFAKRIAVSYPEAAQYFPKNKVAFTGNPIRTELVTLQREGAYEFLKLEHDIPTILILGGSLGSQTMNEHLVDALPALLNKYQVIHQTGKNNFDDVRKESSVILENHPHANRYHAFPYLDTLAMRMSAGAADLVISRAGSTIFEIAAWAKPSIIIPIPLEVSHDQVHNAYAYARAGCTTVIEESNLNHHILELEIDRILQNPSVRDSMVESAKAFARLDSAKLISDEILNIALSHEQ